MSLSVIIPVFNEEKTISKILEKVLEQKEVSKVIVVDDGSTDNTLSILKTMKRGKIKLLSNAQNKGKGAALRRGLKHAKAQFVIFQDADLEYNPAEYRKLLKRASDRTVIYGSRLKKKNPKAYFRTYLGNVLVTSLCNLLFGTNLTDSYTCYKLLPTQVAQSLRLKSSGFEIEAEITAKLARSGIEIMEIPISYKPRCYKQGKKIKASDAAKGGITFLRIKFTPFI